MIMLMIMMMIPFMTMVYDGSKMIIITIIYFFRLITSVLKRFNGYSDVTKASISDNVLTLLTAYHDQLLLVFDPVVDGKTNDGKKVDLKSMKNVLTGVKDTVDFIHKVITATTTSTTANTISTNNSSSSSSSDGTVTQNNKKRVLNNHNHHHNDDNNDISSIVTSTVKNKLSSKYVLQQIWKQLIVLLEWMSKYNSTSIHTSLIQLHGMIIKSIDATIITIKSNTTMIDANEVKTTNTRDDHDDDYHQHDNKVAKIQKTETKKAKKAKKDHK